MSDQEIVDSCVTAIINAPIENIGLPQWSFTLPGHEYQGCSPAHVAAGFTTSPDGKRMSIAHNQGETPLFAAGIERAAMRK